MTHYASSHRQNQCISVEQSDRRTSRSGLSARVWHSAEHPQGIRRAPGGEQTGLNVEIKSMELNTLFLFALCDAKLTANLIDVQFISAHETSCTDKFKFTSDSFETIAWKYSKTSKQALSTRAKIAPARYLTVLCCLSSCYCLLCVLGIMLPHWFGKTQSTNLHRVLLACHNDNV